MTKAEQFAKLNGIEFSTKINSFECPYCGSESFTDAKSILKVMKGRKDWFKFRENVGAVLIKDTGGLTQAWIFYLNERYVFKPELLLDEAIKFCEVVK